MRRIIMFLLVNRLRLPDVSISLESLSKALLFFSVLEFCLIGVVPGFFGGRPLVFLPVFSFSAKGFSSIFFNLIKIKFP